MPDETSIAKAASIQIPHFWYDLLGRIVPGAFLLVGLFSNDWQVSLVTFVHKFVGDFPLTSQTFGFFLFFAAASYFAGLFLGAISYWIVDVPLAAISPLTWESISARSYPQLTGTLEKYVRTVEQQAKIISTPPLLRPRWLGALRTRIMNHRRVMRCSEVLAHSLWTWNPALAALVSRWAADALAGRSVAVVSLGLMVFQRHSLSLPTQITLFVLFAAGIQIHLHYRGKQANAFYLAALSGFGASQVGA
jgi:hypothetical protein